MIFVIDVGNTNTVMGVYQGSTLVQNWRVRTEQNATEDEFHVLISNLFAMHAIDPGVFTRTVISCVVPPMMTILDAFCRKYLGHSPIWVDARNCAAMPILYDNPAEVGADRIVNAVGAYDKYRTSMIIIDFGTATTFDAISERGEYLGGAISPGIQIASEALFQKASKLPRVDILKPPETVVGKNTISSIKAGIIYGYAGLVDGMVRRMASEMGGAPKVIATGGLAPLMKDVAATIEYVESALTLEGLRIISEATDATAL
ncbi:MAG: type III pantothenate kinase [Desulfosarcina sp.]|nr:type III pantothenate kinase [Desulfobacterales bacterium]